MRGQHAAAATVRVASEPGDLCATGIDQEGRPPGQAEHISGQRTWPGCWASSRLPGFRYGLAPLSSSLLLVAGVAGSRDGVCSKT